VWLEGNERRRCPIRGRGVLEVPDNLEVAEMNAVKAADRQRDGTDWFRRKPYVDLQCSTFSGTNVLRRGSV
jgi:hypothetical protein